MKKTAIIIIFVCAGLHIDAQAVLSLDDCIRMAVSANIEIKRQQVQADKQAVKTNMQKASRLPNLNLDGTQKFDFGRSLNRDNTYNDINSQTSSFSLNTEVGLFAGGKTANTIRQSKIEHSISTETLEKVKNDVALRVVSRYYQILLDKEIAAIAHEQIQLTREQEEMTIILANHGKVAESQVLDVRAQLADDELRLVKAENTLRLSMVDLCQLLELTETDKFDIMPISIDTVMPLLVSPDDIFNLSQQAMPEIRMAHLQIESYEKAVKIAKADFLPTIALAASINSGYYHYSSYENQAFTSQLRNNLQKTVYLSLRIPLFNRLNTRNAVRLAKKDLMDGKLAADDALKILYKDIQKTWHDALSAREKYTSTVHAVNANAEALRYAKERYQAGKSTVYEYNEAKLKLANSRSEQAQAKYEYALQAKILDFYAGIPIR